jgi:hypothetical protein
MADAGSLRLRCEPVKSPAGTGQPRMHPRGWRHRLGIAQDPSVTVGSMRVIRDVATWVGGWLVAAGVIFAGLAIRTYARGGVFHRVTGCYPDTNIYDAAIASGALALFVVLAYGALGAVSPRRRWGRLIVVAALALLLASITSVTTCRGGPFLPTTPSP